MERYLGILLIIGLTFFAKNFWQSPAILGETSPSPTETLPVNQPVTTESSFKDKLQEETEILSKKIVYQDDPETEAGEEKINRALGDCAETYLVGTFEEGILLAYQKSRTGDIILLSPGCASYDMFRNYEERGNYFKKIVSQL